MAETQPCACCKSDCFTCGDCEFSPDATVEFSFRRWLCRYENNDCTGAQLGGVAGVAEVFWSSGPLPQIAPGTFAGPGRHYSAAGNQVIATCEGVEIYEPGCMHPITGEDTCGVQVGVRYNCDLGRWEHPFGGGWGPFSGGLTACAGGSATHVHCEGDSYQTIEMATITVHHNTACEDAPPP